MGDQNCSIAILACARPDLAVNAAARVLCVQYLLIEQPQSPNLPEFSALAFSGLPKLFVFLLLRKHTRTPLVFIGDVINSIPNAPSFKKKNFFTLTNDLFYSIKTSTTSQLPLFKTSFFPLLQIQMANSKKPKMQEVKEAGTPGKNTNYWRARREAAEELRKREEEELHQQKRSEEMGEEEGMKEGKREKEKTAEREKEEKKRRSLKSATPKKKTEKVKTLLRSQAKLVLMEVGAKERRSKIPLFPQTPVAEGRVAKTPFTNIISFTNSTSNEAASLPGGEPTGSQNG